jgi:hypothetical protein
MKALCEASVASVARMERSGIRDDDVPLVSVMDQEIGNADRREGPAPSPWKGEGGDGVEAAWLGSSAVRRKGGYPSIVRRFDG